MLWLKIEALFPGQAENMRLARDYLRQTGVWDEIASAEQMGRIWKGIEAELFGALANTRSLAEMAGVGGKGDRHEGVGANVFRVSDEREERLAWKCNEQGRGVWSSWIGMVGAVVFLIVVSVVTYYLAMWRK